jgi:3-hydroxybutyryl-CoA dehydrogenase
VHAKSTPGFIVNRVARPYYAEALRVLHEGGADCATIDAVMREAGGFRMGPFELMDMIGHDVNFAVTNARCGAPSTTTRASLPSLIQQELVDAGFFGKKSGRGFYDYREGAERPLPQQPSAQQRAAGQDHRLASRPPRRRWPSACSAAGGVFSRAPDSDGRIAEAGGAVLFVSPMAAAPRNARLRPANANTVLIDLALDYTKPPAGDQPAPRNATRRGRRHRPVAGRRLCRVAPADIPGLAVMRTVAMLANEAADAVNQGVCETQAPIPPCAWASITPAARWPGPMPSACRIQTCWPTSATSYGEDRYRISPLIQQQRFCRKEDP